MSLNPKFIYIFLISFSLVAAQENIEEIVVTGTLIKDAESDLSPVQMITAKDYENLNITNIGEISKYLSISSGSRFQSNALEGVDQGMSSITLRGLDHSATLLLLNSKRHAFSGTPSNKGDGYIDANIVPEIAIEKIEILKEGATSIYGSDAIAGVINFLTYKDFDGLKVKIGKQKTSNYNQEDVSFGLLYGTNIFNGDLVIGLNSLERSALSASEIPGIAELGLSGLGKTFKLLGSDEVSAGIYAGSYPKESTFVPDPNCESNGGVLDGSFCRFLYGERFNVVNDESHLKTYLSFSKKTKEFEHKLHLITSRVQVNDNPQSPSYPALPFLSREIEPGEGGSPFNVPVVWYGRPLGSEFKSPKSPKDIEQFNFNYSLYFVINQKINAEVSLTKSEHSNDHYRPDIIDSRFLAAIKGNGGINSNEMWNIFDSSQNSQSLIDYVRGAEVSSKISELISLDATFKTNIKNFDVSYGFQSNNESININYDDLSRAEFNSDGKILKTADLFFLGGGIDVSKSRRSNALFVEIEKDIFDNFVSRFAARYESMNNESSFDPKISFKYSPTDSFFVRFSRGTAFSSPSMAQMYSSEINLGSVRDINSSVFVRQASLGNPNLKSASSTNSNLGFIYQFKATTLSLDLWEIDYKNRIEVESAQAILSSNPNGPSVTRNEFGDLIGVSTTYFNEKNTFISGIDFQFEYIIGISKGDLSINIMGTSLTDFLTPSLNSPNKMINRIGKFNFDNHVHSLPKKRINSFINWSYKNFVLGFSTRYIDGYKNEREITGLGLIYGYQNAVKSFLVHDVSLKTTKGNLSYSIYLSNLLDKSAPRLYDAPDFSFDTRVHDPRGRILGLNIGYEF
ncbi:TonB-dependent receptor [Gammaproteobacteria bacterium]|nr:TonB-dependent receptor [Gammaproteobacteria bacterium]